VLGGHPSDNLQVFADKAYYGAPNSTQGLIWHIPPKKAKGEKHLDAADKLLSSAISKTRQPIESFFNWLQEKTGIQTASKVRSTRGLLAHIFGRLCAAFILLVGWDTLKVQIARA